MSKKLIQNLTVGANVLQLFELNPLFGSKEYIIEYTDAIKCTIKPLLRFKDSEYIEENDLARTVFFNVHTYYEILKCRNDGISQSAKSLMNLREIRDMIDLIKLGKLYQLADGGTGIYLFFEDFLVQEVSPDLRKYLHGVNEKRRHIVVNINNFMKGDLVLYVEDREGLFRNEQEILKIGRLQIDVPLLKHLIYRHTLVGVTPHSILQQLNITPLQVSLS